MTLVNETHPPRILCRALTTPRLSARGRGSNSISNNVFIHPTLTNGNDVCIYFCVYIQLVLPTVTSSSHCGRPCQTKHSSVSVVVAHSGDPKPPQAHRTRGKHVRRLVRAPLRLRVSDLSSADVFCDHDTILEQKLVHGTSPECAESIVRTGVVKGAHPEDMR